jgi:ATP-dependent helicase HrpB
LAAVGHPGVLNLSVNAHLQESYPVEEILGDLKSRLSTQRIVILQAPPGAGKSTILPLKLLEEPWLANKKIIMLEPRRLAARSVAGRMAYLRGENAGATIGYRVRFDTKISTRTKIEVVTEGILTRMLQEDNSLEGTGLVIFDEFHERSIHADLALALTLQIQEVLREDLRILIMSATIDGDQLSSVLGNVPVITSKGKQYPVDLIYSPQESDARTVERMVVVIRRALREQEGDILAFFPGAGEIIRAKQVLEEEDAGAIICPLYGDLPFVQQQEAIMSRSDRKRKVVLATSIAETSLTIEGIRVVIDCGLSRVPRFDPRSGLTRLETVRVTKDSADQRAGRSGRLGPGICYRLWTEVSQRNLLPSRKPEILEADLAPLMLELANWGIKDINEISWVTRPPSGAVSQALELLGHLRAIDSNGITQTGREMLRLPTHPRIAHMLNLKHATQNASLRLQSLACDLAAVLEERDPLDRDAGADITLRVEVLRKWRSGEKTRAERNILERLERLAANWRRLLKVDVDNTIPGHHDTGKLLSAAYPERIARQKDTQSDFYTLSNGRVARLPDHDPLMHEPWLCVAQLDAGQREGKIFLAAPLDERDLFDLAVEADVVKWDADRKMVTSTREKSVGGLLLQARPTEGPGEAEKNMVLVSEIKSQGLKMLGWDEADIQFQARVVSLRKWRPDESWPDVSDEHLLETLDHWLIPFLTGIYKQNDLHKLDRRAMLIASLPWEFQQRLDKLAPVSLEVPSGSMVRIHYFIDGKAPVMEVRLQEVFGLLETPTVNDGKTKLLLHLLSPGYKPVQVTQDLKSFWNNTYHEVRNELKRRYPKHSWPEDPWTAIAVRGVPKRKS